MNKKKTVMSVIIRQEGSAPRKTGTRCLILEDKTLIGTIGGGLLEYQVIEKAGEVFKTGRSDILQFKLSGKDAAESEMLCGGEVDVFLEPVFPKNKTACRVFHAIKDMLHKGYAGTLLTLVKKDLPYDDEDCRILFKQSGDVIGRIGTSEKAIIQKFENQFKIKKPYLMEPDGLFNKHPIFVEPIKPDDVLYIFGAGHVSRTISSIASKAGFKIFVIDDREELVTKDRFPDAGKRISIPFVDAFEQIAINNSSYIVIVTRGHLYDKEVLEAALNTSPAYIGMIGSRKKRGIIYQTLIDKGISNEMLKEVHSPIGLDIGAETPEEIAVSIVAELIKVRSGITAPKP